MTAATFDALDYFNELKAVGVPEPQAQVHAHAIARLIDEKLATKDDLKKLKLATKEDFRRLEKATKEDIKRLEETTKHDIQSLEERLTYKLTIRFGSMMAAVMTLAVLIKIL